MVEFALALPIFLLVVYGLLEVGRLVFMYAAVTTASREAVRYASGWGINNSAEHQYLDCAGIRGAAKNVGFLLGLQDTDIVISYDSGPGTAGAAYCTAGTTSPWTTPSLDPGQRVIVTVTATYRPVLRFFLPLTQQTITSTTRRTLMGIIALTPGP